MKLSQEMRWADFGDERLSARLAALSDALVARPSVSFPQALSPKELEGAYRFFDNRRVSPDQILQPHVEATAQRCREQRRVRVAHDTTEVNYGRSQRRGLGRLRKNGAQGFLCHCSLALGPGEAREPLGVLGSLTWVRDEGPKPKTARRSVRGGNPASEAARWLEQVRLSQSRLPDGTDAVHVMDRESDSYGLLAQMDSEGIRFVVRARHDRVVALPPEHRVAGREKLSDVLSRARVIAEREVTLTRRKGGALPVQRKRHPPREQRVARLAIAAATVQLRRTEYVSPSLPQWLEVHVVRVHEVDPPAGQQPVEWVLLTNQPVATPEQVLTVVDDYRARWMIEEYFKALKSGCLIEERQLEDLHNLLNALATLMPVAWQLLRLRHLARNDPGRPATDVLTTTQIRVLRAVGHEPLGPRPTVRHALLAIARLGGHLAHNGEPGWQVLARGLQQLLLLDVGYQAASSRRKTKK
jgi:hypothetical protein